jgi:hypothetical protein
MREIMKLQKTITAIYEMTGKTVLQSVFITLFCVFFLSNASTVKAAIRVNTTQEMGTPAICSTGAPGCSLRNAITLANQDPGGPDIIEFNIPATDPNCSAGACTVNLTSPLPAMIGFISIFGPGKDKLTVKNAANFNAPVFEVQGIGGVVEFNGLTINGGNGSQDSARGIFAIDSIGKASVRVIGCVITGNSAAQGAAIGASMDMTISQSLITGNTGVAIYNYHAEMNITNTTITRNTGRGIENEEGTVNLRSSTVSNNTSNGIVNTGTGAVFNVKNSIIALNANTFFSDVIGAFVSEGFNLIGKRDSGTGFTAPSDQTGTILAPLNPRLDPGGLKDNGGATKTIALMSNSPAIDKGSNSVPNGNLVRDQRDSTRPFDNPAIPNAAGGNGTDIGALERRNSPFDFDGDGRTDIGVWRASSGSWWFLNSSNLGSQVYSFGAASDIITPGDFTGDGKADVAIFRPSTGFWFIQRSDNNSFFSFPFGAMGDVPAPADYDGDGITDAAVFRPTDSTWYIRRSSDFGTSIVTFGNSQDKPVPADYDGDGKSDIAIFRPSDGSWWYLRSTNLQYRVFRFGVSTDKPVQGDYTGDGKADIAIFRPSTGEWFVQRSEDNSFYSVPFGASSDIPSPGDYDSDGKFDAAVFRPSTNTWYVNGSGAGSMIVTFGSVGDRPVANAFVP